MIRMSIEKISLVLKFGKYDEPDLQSNLIDLIADALHYADTKNLSPLYIADMAIDQYEVECDAMKTRE